MLQAHGRPQEPRPPLCRKKRQGPRNKLWGWAPRRFSEHTGGWAQGAGPRSAASIARTHRVRRAGPWRGAAAGLERRCGARRGAQGPRGRERRAGPEQAALAARAHPAGARGWRGTELSAVRQGPGGRRSGIAHYLEDPPLPEALGLAASRKPKNPGAVAALSSAGSELASTRAPRGRDAARAQMPAGVPALRLSATSPVATPSQGVCPPPPPLPTRTFPKNESLEARSPLGHLLSVAKPTSKYWFSPGVGRVP